MKVSVLGIGKIGGTLGSKWARAGHEVTFGVRDLDTPRTQGLPSEADGSYSVDTIANAITSGEVVVFAVPGKAVEAIVETNAQALNGKIIIDATNNVGEAEMSSVSTLVGKAPGARVFRAFNTLGWENFAEPQFGSIQADLFYCGSEERRSREAVERLIEDIGLRPVRVGGLDQVQLLDAVTRLWFALAMGQKMGRHLAFKVLQE